MRSAAGWLADWRGWHAGDHLAVRVECLEAREAFSPPLVGHLEEEEADVRSNRRARADDVHLLRRAVAVDDANAVADAECPLVEERVFLAPEVDD
jgi:hypothetical protein